MDRYNIQKLTLQKAEPAIQTWLMMICLLIVSKQSVCQVGVNILTPHPSAALQIEAPTGTTKGLLTPSMTTVQRMTITTGTNTASDGLIVYDTDHKMHYYFNSGAGKWSSMSPLTLSSPTVASTSYPSGVITTPASSATFSLGINNQNPVQALDVVGNSAVSGNAYVGGNSNILGSLYVTNSISVSGYPVNAMVPAGAIVMWTGNSAPAGWAICDGSSGTPDLRGRFIVGFQSGGSASPASLSGTATANVTNYGAIGNTGGENAHTSLLSEMPQHKHNVSSTIINGSQGNNLAFQLNASCSGCATTQMGGNYQNIQENFLSITTTESLQGNNQPQENRPPYYVLAFIMKLP